MVKRFLVFYFLTLVSVLVSAQMFDPVRAGLFSNYDIRMRDQINAQSVALGTMTFHHKWIQAKEKDITKLQEEFNKYLLENHNTIAMAAQLYGVYYELTEISNNQKGIEDVCRESPANILANAFKDDKRQIVTNIVGATTDLIYDIKKTYLDNTRMTEKERLQLVDDVRRHMKWCNRQLKRIERNIRYYNLCDLWNDIRNKEYVFRKKSNAEIAREARDRWQEHYKFIFSDVQRNDTALRDPGLPY